MPTARKPESGLLIIIIYRNITRGGGSREKPQWDLPLILQRFLDTVQNFDSPWQYRIISQPGSKLRKQGQIYSR